MQRRFLHQEYPSLLFTTVGLPMVAAFVAVTSTIYESGFKPIHLTAVTLLLIGAGLIIQSKIGEAFTSRWKQLGPPIDESKRKKYSFGYTMYVVGFLIMLYQYFI